MVKQKLTITELAEEDRPREKMLSQGIRALSTAELIAILIGSGNRNETAVELSQRILNSADNDLNRLGKYSVSDFVTLFYDRRGESHQHYSRFGVGPQTQGGGLVGGSSARCVQQRYFPYFLSVVGRFTLRRVLDIVVECAKPGDQQAPG